MKHPTGISRHLGRLAAVVGIGVLVAACAPSGPAGSSPSASSAPTAPKTLRIGLQAAHEPASGVTTYGGPGGFGALENFFVFHASMTVYEPSGAVQPRLVERIPTIQNGDWVTHPDGRMDVTWKLKDTKWHDGAPFTSADLVLGYQILIDPEVPLTKPAWAPLIASFDTLDPRTLVVHWKQPYYQANGEGAGGINPAPVHILAKNFESMDKKAFLNLPYWTDEFVGLGPYRLTQWVRGSHLEGAAYDGYVLGKPKFDKVLVRYIGDIHSLLAGMLASDLDVVPMGSQIDTTPLTVLRRAWGTEGTTMLIPFNVRNIHLQMRDPTAPWAKDIRVRQAMSHSLDRVALSEALQDGLAPPAYTYVMPEDAAFKVLEQGGGFAKFPYDPNRAHQLLSQAGWNLAADGLLRDASGQPLAFEFGATAQSGNVEEIVTMASLWQRLGYQTTPTPLPPTSGDIAFLRNNVKGGFNFPGGVGLGLRSSLIATESTAWRGTNYSGYNSPVYDQLYDRFQVTLDLGERLKVHADIMRLLATDLPNIPIYYYGVGLVARKGITGPGMLSPSQTANAWNISEWDEK